MKDILQVSPVQDIHGLWLDVDSFNGYPIRDYKHRVLRQDGEQYVVRKDYDGANMGVIYTPPELIGAVVTQIDTGRKASA